GDQRVKLQQLITRTGWQPGNRGIVLRARPVAQIGLALRGDDRARQRGRRSGRGRRVWRGDRRLLLHLGRRLRRRVYARRGGGGRLLLGRRKCLLRGQSGRIQRGERRSGRRDVFDGGEVVGEWYA